MGHFVSYHLALRGSPRSIPAGRSGHDVITGVSLYMPAWGSTIISLRGLPGYVFFLFFLNLLFILNKYWHMPVFFVHPAHVIHLASAGRIMVFRCSDNFTS